MRTLNEYFEEFVKEEYPQTVNDVVAIHVLKKAFFTGALCTMMLGNECNLSERTEIAKEIIAVNKALTEESEDIQTKSSQQSFQE